MIDFDKIKTSKVSLHYFPNSEMSNGESTSVLYIDGGKINFRNAARFTGSKNQILSDIRKKLGDATFQKFRKTLSRFCEDYPEHEYQVYHDEETSFYYMVAGQSETQLVVRCKMSNTRNARMIDFFTNSIAERSGKNSNGPISYFVHSMSKVKTDAPEITEQKLSDIAGLALGEMMAKGSFSDLYNCIMNMEKALISNLSESFNPVIEDDTNILTVGQYYAGGIISKRLQSAFLISVAKQDFQTFNARCDEEFDSLNQIRTPVKAAFRGKIWIIDLKNPVEEGYALWKEDKKAHELYKKKKAEAINSDL